MADSHTNTIPLATATGTYGSGRWLAIVGIGEDGVVGLNEPARQLIESAEVVYGGTRHLSLAKDVIRGASRSWSSPLEESIREILASRGRPVCVLASGDPFQHGIGSLLARHVSPDETIVIPRLSAFSLAAALLLWSLQQTTLLTFCGRPLEFLRPHLQPGARILALTSGANAPAEIAELLCKDGFSASRITVLEALGGPNERIRSTTAAGFDVGGIRALNTVAIEVAAEATARILPRAPGLEDELFEHDGQLTKREIRALTLSSLAPRCGELLWDVGAGSGSVAIEWMLADPSLSAIAIERSGDRVARIRRNAAAFGVPDLEIIEGDAPQALAPLRAPDAVFVGGGATKLGLIEAVQIKLRPRGRLVVNAVTLESEAVLVRAQSQQGGKLVRLEVQRADPVGGFMSWHPARPITQWIWVKP